MIPSNRVLGRVAAAALALFALLSLGACADNRPIVDPHNQVPFPGSRPVVDPDAVSPDRADPIDNPVPQVADPASHPDCRRLDAATLKPAWRCDVEGAVYVLQ